jgi:hypothetical protein
MEPPSRRASSEFYFTNPPKGDENDKHEVISRPE